MTDTDRRTGWAEPSGAGRHLRRGSLAMAGGLVVSGLASYAFLALAARALGPQRFAPLSVLWAALFVAGPGLFQPVEQELSRSIAARAARGDGFATITRRAALLAAGLFAGVAVGAAAASAWLADLLFGGDRSRVLALVAGVGGYAASHVVRGHLAGTGRYGRYAEWFHTDGAFKALPCLVLLLLGVATTGWYAAVLASAAYLGVLVAGRGRWDLGPDERTRSTWSELTRSMGHLLLTSFAVAALLNSGTVAVEVLATPSQADRAGIFLTGLVIARVPLFFYQAVQAALLPRLADLASRGQIVDLRRQLGVVLAGLASLTMAAVAAAYLMGSWLVGLLFGAEYRDLSGTDMAALALSSMLAMGALTLGQALIALHLQARTWWPWLAGLTVFGASAAWASDDLFVRVEVASVLSSAVVLVLMAAQVVAAIRARDAAPLGVDEVYEQLRDLPVEGA